MASFSYLKCPSHTPEQLPSNHPMTGKLLYSLIISSIFHSRTVNRMGKWGAGERLVRRLKNGRKGPKRRITNHKKYKDREGEHFGAKMGNQASVDKEERIVYFFPNLKMAAEASQCLLPLLIIPIIMALYENVINNTADIVVAISHMVVGLCSVTNLPLASTYVCQRRAAMTRSSSAHLALPTERCALGAEDELGVPPGFTPG